MIKDWINVEKKVKKFKSFTLINANEKKVPSDDILNYLGEEVINSYRLVSNLKKSYKKEPKSKLIEYLNTMVFPPANDQFNVRQGDFGETVARLFIEKFTSLNVPCYKLRHKFNNTKSVFCTDIFAHNNGEDITSLKYYEVKTKTNKQKTNIIINGKKERRHIGVIAHEGLAKDENKISTEYVADFIKRKYEEMANVFDDENQFELGKKYWNIAMKYDDIVKNPQNYDRSFELILIIEKDQYLNEIVDDLISLPPTLNPLDVTIILINNLSDLVDTCIDKAIEITVKNVYGK